MKLTGQAFERELLKAQSFTEVWGPPEKGSKWFSRLFRRGCQATP